MWWRRVATTALVSLLTAVVSVGVLAAPTIKDVRIGQHNHMTRLVLDLTETVGFKIFTLAGPDRVVIDMPSAYWALEERIFAIGRAGVAQVRFGYFTPETSRLVLDLARPLALQQTRLLAPSAGGAVPHRLVLDFVPVSATAFLATAKAAAAAPAAQSQDAAPAAQPSESATEAPKTARAARSAEPVEPAGEPPKPAPAAPAAPAAQSAKPARETPKPATAAQPAEPMAEARITDPAEPVPQPRAKPAVKPVRYLIALDPGHGGRDPGATAASGVTEKTVVLTFARELRAALDSSGRYRVVMTRNSDRKISLHRRVDIARDAGADLFLSIHVDRLKDARVRGASVYTLSNEASDVEAAELAARENKADIVADVDLSEGYDEEVAKVLISLVQQNTMNCSAVLAARLLPELGRVAPLINRSHRFADFRVLKAPDIPSVLIELGFLSNDQDAERLRSESHRAVLAGAIVRTLDTYFREPC